MTANTYTDLLTDEVMELFVDDGGTAADPFDDMASKNYAISSPEYGSASYR